MTILVRALYKYYSAGRRVVDRPRRQWIEVTRLRVYFFISIILLSNPHDDPYHLYPKMF